MFQSASLSNFPTHTVLLIVFLAGVLAVISWFVLAQGLSKSTVSRASQRNILAIAGAILVIWFVLRLGLAVYPENGVRLSTPTVIGLTAMGLLVGVLPLLWSPFRQAIRAIPMTWLIALHTLRFAGGSNFLTLLDANLLPRNFALPAGYGDIFVALLSMVVIYVITTNRPNARVWVTIWLIFGFLDFISAFATGGTFLEPFAAHLAASGGPVSVINFVLLIPTFVVPILASIQFYVIYQLLPSTVRSGFPQKITVSQTL